MLDSAGVIALIAIALLLTQTDEYSMFLYRGGILLLSLATALLIAVSTHPASLIGKAIGVLPLRWIGERSYGIYLWHLPVIVFLPESVLEDSPWRSVLLCVIIVALAALSWSLVEDPIRRRGLLGALRRGREHRAWAGQQTRSANRGHGTPLLGNVLALVLVATAGLTALTVMGPSTSSSAAQTTAGGSAAGGAGYTPPDPAPETPSGTATTSARSGAVGHDDHGTRRPGLPQDLVHRRHPHRRLDLAGSDGPRRAPERRRPDRRAVQGLFGAEDRLHRHPRRPVDRRAVEQPAQRRGRPQTRQAAGFHGCWVFAMGLNEAANQAVGGNTPLDKRIDLLMQHVGNEPVMWLTVEDAADQDGLRREPDGQVQRRARRGLSAVPRTCGSTTGRPRSRTTGSPRTRRTTPAPGWKERGHRTAEALAIAFPKDGQSPNSCLIRNSRLGHRSSSAAYDDERTAVRRGSSTVW